MNSDPQGFAAGEERVSRLSRHWIFARLPASYREAPGILAAFSEALSERLEELAAALRGTPLPRGASDRPPGGAVLAAERLAKNGPPVLATERARSGSGTRGDIARFFAATGRPAPRIFAGLTVAPRGDRWIEIRRSAWPSALLVWERGAPGKVPESSDLSPAAFPAPLRLQAVLIRRMPSGRRFVPGEVLQGVVLWSVPPPGTEPSRVEALRSTRPAGGR